MRVCCCICIGVAALAGACSESHDSSARPRIDSAALAIDTATATQHSLKTAAENVIGFLHGDADFESLRLADTIEFFLPSEAGGTRRRVSRRDLSDRHAWKIGSGSNSYSFVPPARFTQMTVQVGRHYNCMETALGSRVPALANALHVGVRLQPPDARSCLESWNATFVFDTTGGIVRLTGAVYDSWEW